jgi:hypothetical protein
MSFTSELFVVDGTKASDIGSDGAVLIRTNAEINRPIMGQKNIIKDIIRYKNTPYFYTVEKDVLTFELKISLLDKEIDDERLQELAILFGKDRYVSFSSMDYPQYQFYIICTSAELITYGSYKGWVSLKLENFSGFAVSTLNVITKDFSNLTTTQTFEIDAKFNVMHPKYKEYYYFPKILIDMKGSATSITFSNISDGGRTFGFTGLTTGESLEIENEIKQIESSTGNYRINNLVNHQWFRLVRGKNLISVNAPCIIQIICQYYVYI